MMTRADCPQAEALAGAIALGEADQSEREAYRRHIAGCARCLSSLGGEREIERVMGIVREARDLESWEPDLRAAPRGAWRGDRGWRAAAAAAAVFVAFFIGARIVQSRPPAMNVAPQIVVVHNVITLKPASEREDRAVAELGTQRAPRLENRAESLAVGTAPPVVADVAPLGGEDAIVPRPPSIAYSEGAQGTTAFEVSVDAHGKPVRCTITKSSGYAVLDASVCRAAMQVRYSPRRLNGRAVPGEYRDAFTFRTSDGQ